MIQILLVDDSPFFAGMIEKHLGADPRMVVAHRSPHGEDALAALERQKFDVILLDIEMPVMDGLTFLERCRGRRLPPVIVMSSLTRSGSRRALAAYDLGATDCLEKPALEARETGEDFFVALDRAIVKAAYANPSREDASSRRNHQSSAPRRTVRPRAVLIGISTGGPATLRRFFARLATSNGHLPFIVAQHMPTRMTAALASSLQQHLGLPFHEARHGDDVTGGFYILPGGMDTELARRGGNVEFIKSAQNAEQSRFYHPSIDALFESASEAFMGAVVGIVMTGMGHDGVKGALSLRLRGGVVYAQDEASSVVYGMPRAVIECGLANHVGGPESLADALSSELGASVARETKP